MYVEGTGEHIFLKSLYYVFEDDVTVFRAIALKKILPVGRSKDISTPPIIEFIGHPFVELAHPTSIILSTSNRIPTNPKGQ